VRSQSSGDGVPRLPGNFLTARLPEKKAAGRSVTEQTEDFVAASAAFAHRFAGLVACVLSALSCLPTMQSNRKRCKRHRGAKSATRIFETPHPTTDRQQKSIRRPTMNRFQSATPRVALGIAAVAMTVVTFCLLVVVPATIDSGGENVPTQAAAKLVTPAATEVAIIPTRIDVLGVRKTEMASAPVSNVRPKRKQAG
jgi:hypothetical protein